MISQAYWLGLSKETRLKLAELFDLSRSTFTHVEGNTVVSDGYSLRDLAGITKEKMQEYTGETHDDFYKLLEATIEKLTAPSVETPAPEVQEEVKAPQKTKSKKYGSS